MKYMFDWLNAKSYKQIAFGVSGVFLATFLLGGQLFVVMGYAHEEVSYYDAAWPAFALSFIVLIIFFINTWREVK
jgi:hypothetical protein